MKNNKFYSYRTSRIIQSSKVKQYFGKGLFNKIISVLVTVCFVISIINLPAFADEKKRVNEILDEDTKQQDVLHQADATYSAPQKAVKQVAMKSISETDGALKQNGKLIGTIVEGKAYLNQGSAGLEYSEQFTNLIEDKVATEAEKLGLGSFKQDENAMDGQKFTKKDVREEEIKDKINQISKTTNLSIETVTFVMGRFETQKDKNEQNSVTEPETKNKNILKNQIYKVAKIIEGSAVSLATFLNITKEKEAIQVLAEDTASEAYIRNNKSTDRQVKTVDNSLQNLAVKASSLIKKEKEVSIEDKIKQEYGEEGYKTLKEVTDKANKERKDDDPEITLKQVYKEFKKAGVTKDQLKEVSGTLLKQISSGSKIINCSADSLSNYLGISKIVAAIQQLAVDIAENIFLKNNKAGDSQIKTSMLAQKKVSEINGKSSEGYKCNLDDFISGLKPGESSVMWVNGDHYIMVNKKEDMSFGVTDINVNDGKEVIYSEKEFKKLMSNEQAVGTDAETGKKVKSSGYKATDKNSNVTVLTDSKGVAEKGEKLSKEQLKKFSGASSLFLGSISSKSSYESSYESSSSDSESSSSSSSSSDDSTYLGSYSSGNITGYNSGFGGIGGSNNLPDFSFNKNITPKLGKITNDNNNVNNTKTKDIKNPYKPKASVVYTTINGNKKITTYSDGSIKVDDIPESSNNYYPFISKIAAAIQHTSFISKSDGVKLNSNDPKDSISKSKGDYLKEYKNNNDNKDNNKKLKINSGISAPNEGKKIEITNPYKPKYSVVSVIPSGNKKTTTYSDGSVEIEYTASNGDKFIRNYDASGNYKSGVSYNAKENSIIAIKSDGKGGYYSNKKYANGYKEKTHTYANGNESTDWYDYKNKLVKHSDYDKATNKSTVKDKSGDTKIVNGKYEYTIDPNAIELQKGRKYDSKEQESIDRVMDGTATEEDYQRVVDIGWLETEQGKAFIRDENNKKQRDYIISNFFNNSVDEFANIYRKDGILSKEDLDWLMVMAKDLWQNSKTIVGSSFYMKNYDAQKAMYKCPELQYSNYCTGVTEDGHLALTKFGREYISQNFLDEYVGNKESSYDALTYAYIIQAVGGYEQFEAMLLNYCNKGKTKYTQDDVVAAIINGTSDICSTLENANTRDINSFDPNDELSLDKFEKTFLPGLLMDARYYNGLFQEMKDFIDSNNLSPDSYTIYCNGIELKDESLPDDWSSDSYSVFVTFHGEENPDNPGSYSFTAYKGITEKGGHDATSDSIGDYKILGVEMAWGDTTVVCDYLYQKLDDGKWTDFSSVYNIYFLNDDDRIWQDFGGGASSEGDGSNKFSMTNAIIDCYSSGCYVMGSGNRVSIDAETGDMLVAEKGSRAKYGSIFRQETSSGKTLTSFTVSAEYGDYGWQGCGIYVVATNEQLADTLSDFTKENYAEDATEVSFNADPTKITFGCFFGVFFDVRSWLYSVNKINGGYGPDNLNEKGQYGFNIKVPKSGTDVNGSHVDSDVELVVNNSSELKTYSLQNKNINTKLNTNVTNNKVYDNLNKNVKPTVKENQSNIFQWWPISIGDGGFNFSLWGNDINLSNTASQLSFYINININNSFIDVSNNINVGYNKTTGEYGFFENTKIKGQGIDFSSSGSGLGNTKLNAQSGKVDTKINGSSVNFDYNQDEYHYSYNFAGISGENKRSWSAAAPVLVTAGLSAIVNPLSIPFSIAASIIDDQFFGGEVKNTMFWVGENITSAIHFVSEHLNSAINLVESNCSKLIFYSTLWGYESNGPADKETVSKLILDNPQCIYAMSDQEIADLVGDHYDGDPELLHQSLSEVNGAPLNVEQWDAYKTMVEKAYNYYSEHISNNTDRYGEPFKDDNPTKEHYKSELSRYEPAKKRNDKINENIEDINSNYGHVIGIDATYKVISDCSANEIAKDVLGDQYNPNKNYYVTKVVIEDPNNPNSFVTRYSITESNLIPVTTATGYQVKIAGVKGPYTFEDVNPNSDSYGREITIDVSYEVQFAIDGSNNIIPGITNIRILDESSISQEIPGKSKKLSPKEDSDSGKSDDSGGADLLEADQPITQSSGVIKQIGDVVIISGPLSVCTIDSDKKPQILGKGTKALKGSNIYFVTQNKEQKEVGANAIVTNDYYVYNGAWINGTEASAVKFDTSTPAKKKSAQNFVNTILNSSIDSEQERIITIDDDKEIDFDQEFGGNIYSPVDMVWSLKDQGLSCNIECLVNDDIGGEKVHQKTSVSLNAVYNQEGYRDICFEANSAGTSTVDFSEYGMMKINGQKSEEASFNKGDKLGVVYYLERNSVKVINSEQFEDFNRHDKYNSKDLIITGKGGCFIVNEINNEKINLKVGVDPKTGEKVFRKTDEETGLYWDNKGGAILHVFKENGKFICYISGRIRAADERNIPWPEDNNNNGDSSGSSSSNSMKFEGKRNKEGGLDGFFYNCDSRNLSVEAFSNALVAEGSKYKAGSVMPGNQQINNDITIGKGGEWKIDGTEWWNTVNWKEKGVAGIVDLVNVENVLHWADFTSWQFIGGCLSVLKIPVEPLLMMVGIDDDVNKAINKLCYGYEFVDGTDSKGNVVDAEQKNSEATARVTFISFVVLVDIALEILSFGTATPELAVLNSSLATALGISTAAANIYFTAVAAANCYDTYQAWQRGDATALDFAISLGLLALCLLPSVAGASNKLGYTKAISDFFESSSFFSKEIADLSGFGSKVEEYLISDSFLKNMVGKYGNSFIETFGTQVTVGSLIKGFGLLSLKMAQSGLAMARIGIEFNFINRFIISPLADIFEGTPVGDLFNHIKNTLGGDIDNVLEVDLQSSFTFGLFMMATMPLAQEIFGRLLGGTKLSESIGGVRNIVNGQKLLESNSVFKQIGGKLLNKVYGIYDFSIKREIIASVLTVIGVPPEYAKQLSFLILPEGAQLGKVKNSVNEKILRIDNLFENEINNEFNNEVNNEFNEETQNNKNPDLNFVKDIINTYNEGLDYENPYRINDAKIETEGKVTLHLNNGESLDVAPEDFKNSLITLSKMSSNSKISFEDFEQYNKVVDDVIALNNQVDMSTLIQMDVVFTKILQGKLLIPELVPEIKNIGEQASNKGLFDNQFQQIENNNLINEVIKNPTEIIKDPTKNNLQDIIRNVKEIARANENIMNNNNIPELYKKSFLDLTSEFSGEDNIFNQEKFAKAVKEGKYEIDDFIELSLLQSSGIEALSEMFEFSSGEIIKDIIKNNKKLKDIVENKDSGNSVDSLFKELEGKSIEDAVKELDGFMSDLNKVLLLSSFSGEEIDIYNKVKEVFGIEETTENNKPLFERMNDIWKKYENELNIDKQIEDLEKEIETLKENESTNGNKINELEGEKEKLEQQRDKLSGEEITDRQTKVDNAKAGIYNSQIELYNSLLNARKLAEIKGNKDLVNALDKILDANKGTVESSIEAAVTLITTEKGSNEDSSENIRAIIRDNIENIRDTILNFGLGSKYQEILIQSVLLERSIEAEKEAGKMNKAKEEVSAKFEEFKFNVNDKDLKDAFDVEEIGKLPIEKVGDELKLKIGNKVLEVDLSDSYNMNALVELLREKGVLKENSPLKAEADDYFEAFRLSAEAGLLPKNSEVYNYDKDKKSGGITKQIITDKYNKNKELMKNADGKYKESLEKQNGKLNEILIYQLIYEGIINEKDIRKKIKNNEQQIEKAKDEDKGSLEKENNILNEVLKNLKVKDLNVDILNRLNEVASDPVLRTKYSFVKTFEIKSAEEIKGLADTIKNTKEKGAKAKAIEELIDYGIQKQLSSCLLSGEYGLDAIQLDVVEQIKTDLKEAKTQEDASAVIEKAFEKYQKVIYQLGTGGGKSSIVAIIFPCVEMLNVANGWRTIIAADTTTNVNNLVSRIYGVYGSRYSMNRVGHDDFAKAKETDILCMTYMDLSFSVLKGDLVDFEGRKFENNDWKKKESNGENDNKMGIVIGDEIDTAIFTSKTIMSASGGSEAIGTPGYKIMKAINPLLDGTVKEITDVMRKEDSTLENFYERKGKITELKEKAEKGELNSKEIDNFISEEFGIVDKMILKLRTKSGILNVLFNKGTNLLKVDQKSLGKLELTDDNIKKLEFLEDMLENNIQDRRNWLFNNKPEYRDLVNEKAKYIAENEIGKELKNDAEKYFKTFDYDLEEVVSNSIMTVLTYREGVDYGEVGDEVAIMCNGRYSTNLVPNAGIKQILEFRLIEDKGSKVSRMTAFSSKNNNGNEVIQSLHGAAGIIGLTGTVSKAAADVLGMDKVEAFSKTVIDYNEDTGEIFFEKGDSNLEVGANVYDNQIGAFCDIIENFYEGNIVYNAMSQAEIDLFVKFGELINFDVRENAIMLDAELDPNEGAELAENKEGKHLLIGTPEQAGRGVDLGEQKYFERLKNEGKNTDDIRLKLLCLNQHLSYDSAVRQLFGRVGGTRFGEMADRIDIELVGTKNNIKANAGEYEKQYMENLEGENTEQAKTAYKKLFIDRVLKDGGVEAERKVIEQSTKLARMVSSDISADRQPVEYGEFKETLKEQGYTDKEIENVFNDDLIGKYIVNKGDGDKNGDDSIMLKETGKVICGYVIQALNSDDDDKDKNIERINKLNPGIEEISKDKENGRYNLEAVTKAIITLQDKDLLATTISNNNSLNEILMVSKLTDVTREYGPSPTYRLQTMLNAYNENGIEGLLSKMKEYDIKIENDSVIDNMKQINSRSERYNKFMQNEDNMKVLKKLGFGKLSNLQIIKNVITSEDKINNIKTSANYIRYGLLNNFNNRNMGKLKQKEFTNYIKDSNDYKSLLLATAQKDNDGKYWFATSEEIETFEKLFGQETEETSKLKGWKKFDYEDFVQNYDMASKSGLIDVMKIKLMNILEEKGLKKSILYKNIKEDNIKKAKIDAVKEKQDVIDRDNDVEKTIKDILNKKDGEELTDKEKILLEQTVEVIESKEADNMIENFAEMTNTNIKDIKDNTDKYDLPKVFKMLEELQNEEILTSGIKGETVDTIYGLSKLIKENDGTISKEKVKEVVRKYNIEGIPNELLSKEVVKVSKEINDTQTRINKMEKEKDKLEKNLKGGNNKKQNSYQINKISKQIAEIDKQIKVEKDKLKQVKEKFNRQVEKDYGQKNIKLDTRNGKIVFKDKIEDTQKVKDTVDMFIGEIKEAKDEKDYEKIINKYADNSNVVNKAMPKILDILIDKEILETEKIKAYKDLTNKIVFGVTKPEESSKYVAAVLAICKDSNSVANLLGFGDIDSVKDKEQIVKRFIQKAAEITELNISDKDKYEGISILVAARDMLLAYNSGLISKEQLNDKNLKPAQIESVLIKSKAVNMNVILKEVKNIYDSKSIETEDFKTDVEKLRQKITDKEAINKIISDLENKDWNAALEGGRGSADMPIALLKIADVKAVAAAA